ncbi:MAG TPA: MoaD/ThiS family protein [Bacillota bacterium]|nr:MoaD/ThiS family protein [Bacillota bacterium]
MEVRFAGLPRTETGVKAETLELESDITLGKLVDQLNQRYSWEIGRSASYFVLLNQRGLRRERWAHTRLEDGDSVLVISAIAGG